MPKEITQAILSKKQDIEENGLDFNDVLEVKKISDHWKWGSDEPLAVNCHIKSPHHDKK